MSELTLLKVYDWWKINSLWLEKYIKADPNTNWGEEDKLMINAITSLIEGGLGWKEGEANERKR